MEVRKMSKNRLEKYEAVEEIMKGVTSWEKATTPEAITAAIMEKRKKAKKKVIKMSGMTAYLILMDMIDNGSVMRGREGRTWVYANSSAGDKVPSIVDQAEANGKGAVIVTGDLEIGMEPDDPEANAEALATEAAADDEVPFDVEA